MRRTIERDLDRTLGRLRNVIRERGFTQMEVQQALGWGRSYISQILTKQKALRIEQVLLILDVVGVDPAEFFGEIFPPGESTPKAPSARMEAELRHLEVRLEGLVGALKRQGVIEATDLAASIKKARA